MVMETQFDSDVTITTYSVVDLLGTTQFGTEDLLTSTTASVIDTHEIRVTAEPRHSFNETARAPNFFSSWTLTR